ncbi:MAG TPA: hypothetical protein VHD36_12025 [Pirellulales bacterium]|nr:hypothetical protein [Pirellulales bacterium]
MPIRKPLGYRQLTTIDAATTLSPPAGAQYAIIAADSAKGINLRWRDDGTAPTTAVGMEILAGNEEPYTGDLSAVQVIGVSTGAAANVAYYA